MLIIVIIIVGLPLLGWIFGKKIGEILFPSDSTDYKDSTLKNSEYYKEKYDLSDKGEIRNVFEEKPIIKKLTTKEILENIILVKQEDEFEGTTLVYQTNISQKDYRYLPMYYNKITDEIVSIEHIGLSFVIFENNIYLTIYSFAKEMGLAKNDKLILLFENDHRIDLIFQNAPSSGSVKSNSYKLNTKELEIFLNNNLRKWKLISTRRNLYILGDNTLFHENCQIDNQETAQQIIKYLTKNIIFEYLKMNKESTAHNIG